MQVTKYLCLGANYLHPLYNTPKLFPSCFAVVPCDTFPFTIHTEHTGAS